jgi:hypothetical protein
LPRTRSQKSVSSFSDPPAFLDNIQNIFKDYRLLNNFSTLVNIFLQYFLRYARKHSRKALCVKVF